MPFSFPKLIIVCGHYGTGKTNLSLNLAHRLRSEGKSVTLVDLDVVNPYFRSSDYTKELESLGIHVLAPGGAGTTLDIPALPASIFSVFDTDADHVIFDTGGDDAGVTALGRFSGRIKEAGDYAMLYVINQYRVLTTTAEEAASLLPEIEAASRLKATGLVNNSHMSRQTTAADVLASVPFADEVSRLTGLPVLFTTAPPAAAGSLAGRIGNILEAQIYVKFPWENS